MYKLLIEDDGQAVDEILVDDAILAIEGLVEQVCRTSAGGGTLEGNRQYIHTILARAIVRLHLDHDRIVPAPWMEIESTQRA